MNLSLSIIASYQKNGSSLIDVNVNSPLLLDLGLTIIIIADDQYNDYKNSQFLFNYSYNNYNH